MYSAYCGYFKIEYCVLSISFFKKILRPFQVLPWTYTSLPWNKNFTRMDEMFTTTIHESVLYPCTKNLHFRDLLTPFP